MSQSLVTQTDYQSLVTDLQSLIEKGREQALQAITDIRIKTYWDIGKRLHQDKEIPKKGSASEIMQRLGEDLHLDPSVLYRSLKFYRTYPKGLPKDKAAGSLGWTAHLELLPLKDPKEREFYMKRAVAEGWSRDRLRQAIRRKVFHEAKESKGTKERILLKRPVQGLHTYVALVEKVVDGDTLVARIDLGFDVWKTHRIRLRGIDAEPPNTPKGKKAKDYLERTLRQVDFIVLKTYQVDMYYRYVADVFYHPAIKRKEGVFEEGRFLNEELVKKGHAMLVF
jgi:endonuclease YncB( thermonuclease family)